MSITNEDKLKEFVGQTIKEIHTDDYGDCLGIETEEGNNINLLTGGYDYYADLTIVTSDGEYYTIQHDYNEQTE